MKWYRSGRRRDVAFFLGDGLCAEEGVGAGDEAELRWLFLIEHSNGSLTVVGLSFLCILPCIYGKKFVPL